VDSFEEIKLRKLERINSIYFSLLNGVRKDVCKSNSIDSINVEKVKSSLLKDILLKKLTEKEDQVSGLKKQIDKLSIDINTPPRVPSNEFISEQWINRIEIPYNIFSYSQVFSLGNSNMLSSYNSLVKKLVEIFIEIKKISIIINSLSQNYEYSISTSLMEKINLL
jgi:hypothetical protein